MALGHTSDGRQVDTEWPMSLAVGALVAEGCHPTLFQQFIIKIHSRCNLNCDYCYVYELADQSWRTKPTVMSRDMVVAASTRIAEHVAAHGLDHIRVILHGGEPLLAGRGFLSYLVATVRASVGQT